MFVISRQRVWVAEPWRLPRDGAPVAPVSLEKHVSSDRPGVERDVRARAVAIVTKHRGGFLAPKTFLAPTTFLDPAASTRPDLWPGVAACRSAGLAIPVSVPRPSTNTLPAMLPSKPPADLFAAGGNVVAASDEGPRGCKPDRRARVRGRRLPRRPESVSPRAILSPCGAGGMRSVSPAIFGDAPPFSRPAPVGRRPGAATGS